MKKNYIYTFIIVGLLTTSWNGKWVEKGESKKVERAKSRAERSYSSLSYAKSIKRYKKVLSLKPSDSEATVRIADSYRLINDAENASEWYAKAANVGALTAKEDQLNYAQVLSSIGNYDEADKWYALHGENGQMAVLIKNRRDAIDNIEFYYKDSTAYFVNITNFNTEHSDFGPAYTKDGVVFASARPSKGFLKPKYNWDNSNFLDMFQVGKDGKITKIQRGINTRYHEGPAVFYAEDTKVIFTRNNYHKGKSCESNDGINKLKLYYAEKSKNGKKWCPPTELPFNGEDYSVGHPSISEDGKVLYFASDMPGGHGGSDIYRSKWDGKAWGKPENLGNHVNTPGNEFFPFVHQNEKLFYASEGMPGLGGLDVFEITIDSKEVPKNVGYPINTSKDDFGIILSEDGRSGYLSSNRDNGVGHDDIYAFEKYFYDVKVKLIDAHTKTPIAGKITGKLNSDQSLLKEVDPDTELNLQVLRGPNLIFEGSKEGYESIVKNINTLELSKVIKEEYVIELPLKPIVKEEEVIENIILVKNNGQESQVLREQSVVSVFNGTLDEFEKDLSNKDITVGKVFVIQNIYYDFDKFNIRKDASLELDKVVTILKKHGNLTINLSAHTDKRGSNSYNNVLANNRVLAAKNYLIKKKIDSKRILIESFGERKLFVNCKDNCSEPAHQSNRRTEIQLIPKK